MCLKENHGINKRYMNWTQQFKRGTKNEAWEGGRGRKWKKKQSNKIKIQDLPEIWKIERKKLRKKIIEKERVSE